MKSKKQREFEEAEERKKRKQELEEVRLKHEARIKREKEEKIEQAKAAKEEKVQQAKAAEKKFEDERELKLGEIQALAEETIDINQFKNERNIMALPLFSTRSTRHSPRETGPVHHEIVTKKGTKRFTVTPDPVRGMPDEVDANILRFAISKGREIRYKKGYFPDSILTTRYELAKQLGVNPTGQNYQTIIKRIERLCSTRFEGNLFSFNEKDIYFGNLLSFRYKDETSASSPIQISFELNFRKHLEQEDVCLTIPHEILTMQSPLQIRLVELIRLRMGSKVEWVIGLDKLKAQCNIPVEYDLKYFKKELGRIDLPYIVRFSPERKLKDQKVGFFKRE